MAADAQQQREAGAVHVPDSDPSTSYDGLTFVSVSRAGCAFVGCLLELTISCRM